MHGLTTTRLRSQNALDLDAIASGGKVRKCADLEMSFDKCPIFRKNRLVRAIG